MAVMYVIFARPEYLLDKRQEKSVVDEGDMQGQIDKTEKECGLKNTLM